MAKYTNDDELIRGLCQREDTAVVTLTQYLNLAFRSWQGRLGERKEEIFSDVFYKLLLKLCQKSFRIEKSLKAYVNRVLNNTCVDYTRGNKIFSDDNFVLLNLPDGSPDPEQKYHMIEQMHIFFRVMTRLSIECRQLLYLHIIEEKKYREMAEIVGKSTGYVKWRVSKCREEARKNREELS